MRRQERAQLMPNSYHYFESGEVSHERLLLEIELLKQLQKVGLLRDLQWTAYDTPALSLFVQAGIKEARDELTRRFVDQPKYFKQRHFIQQYIRTHQLSTAIEESSLPRTTSLALILNVVLIVVCLSCAAGLFLYEYIRRPGHLLRSLHYPLTAKQRQLSYSDDLYIILLTIASCIILGCTITAARSSRKILFCAVIALVITATLLISKTCWMLAFLSKYREQRWPTLHDYHYV